MAGCWKGRKTGRQAARAVCTEHKSQSQQDRAMGPHLLLPLSQTVSWEKTKVFPFRVPTLPLSHSWCLQNGGMSGSFPVFHSAEFNTELPGYNQAN